MNPSDMLMHVQVPVSVSFGATQIRMKDLLSLTTGSVVELDQALHDNVEVRVNDRVIARGEVVAVDGHYGVRVLELVSGESPGRGSQCDQPDHHPAVAERAGERFRGTVLENRPPRPGRPETAPAPARNGAAPGGCVGNLSSGGIQVKA